METSSNDSNCPTCGKASSYFQAGTICPECTYLSKVNDAKDQYDFFAPLRINKCECGAHVVGFADKGPNHSTWCPMWEKYVN